MEDVLLDLLNEITSSEKDVGLRGKELIEQDIQGEELIGENIEEEDSSKKNLEEDGYSCDLSYSDSDNDPDYSPGQCEVKIL